jgi:hypothetical protein
MIRKSDDSGKYLSNFMFEGLSSSSSSSSSSVMFIDYFYQIVPIPRFLCRIDISIFSAASLFAFLLFLINYSRKSTLSLYL